MQAGDVYESPTSRETGVILVGANWRSFSQAAAQTLASADGRAIGPVEQVGDARWRPERRSSRPSSSRIRTVRKSSPGSKASALRGPSSGGCRDRDRERRMTRRTSAAAIADVSRGARRTMVGTVAGACGRTAGKRTNPPLGAGSSGLIVAVDHQR